MFKCQFLLFLSHTCVQRNIQDPPNVTHRPLHETTLKAIGATIHLCPACGTGFPEIHSMAVHEGLCRIYRRWEPSYNGPANNPWHATPRAHIGVVVGWEETVTTCVSCALDAFENGPPRAACAPGRGIELFTPAGAFIHLFYSTHTAGNCDGHSIY